jgi:hypothetical protein
MVVFNDPLVGFEGWMVLKRCVELFKKIPEKEYLLDGP